MKNIEEYKQIINPHIEDLIFEKTDEKNCLLKKRDCRELGYELENKGKQKLEVILLIGKVTIYRTVLRIKGNINLEEY